VQVKQYQYPGDPPADVAIMSRQEFNRFYPPATMNEEEAYARGANFVIMRDAGEIVCDSCDEDVTGEVWVYRWERPGRCSPGDRAYCTACGKRLLLPYCK
jgi:hypothetical protein